jgi:hypothetical protein
MKILIHNNHNRAEEVITRAEEELALAKLIRRGADRDLMQVQKTVEDLSQKLVVSAVCHFGEIFQDRCQASSEF